jgi:hypothetical protein
MSLTKENVAKNYQKFCTTGEKYGFLTADLKEFLGVDILTAPASTMTSLHNAFEGGLIAHILTVTKYAVKINDTLPDALKVNLESLIKVCCLHQIGKAKLYIPCIEDWRSKRGEIYIFNDDIKPSMRVSERSALYCLSNGVKLTDEEYGAIISFDKGDDDKQSKYYNSMLGDILKIANILAIKEEKLNEQ